MAILQSQPCFCECWFAAGLVSGQRPSEQLLEAEEPRPEQHQYLQAFQLIYIHIARFLSKAVLTMQESHKSVEEISFPAELIQQKNLADVWAVSKSNGQQKSFLPQAANSNHFLFSLSRLFFEDKNV